MTAPKAPSLTQIFTSLSVRWTIIGTLLCLFISSVAFVMVSKHSEEMRLTIIADSAARSFRPYFVEKNYRDGLFQIARTLQLSDNESVAFLNSDLTPAYSLESSPSKARCKKTESACWDLKRGFFAILKPIYFNDDMRDGLLGYLELTLKIQFDSELLILLLAAISGTLLLSSAGLLYSHKKILRKVSSIVTLWAKHLSSSPLSRASQIAPFAELKPLELSISNLGFEIKRLNQIASNEAELKMQTDMLREIRHDLKTPLSQAAKFFATLVSKAERTGEFDNNLADQVRRSLERIGILLRELSFLNSNSSGNETVKPKVDIFEETKTFVSDLKNLPQMSHCEIDLHGDRSEVFAEIPRGQFFRILDNLIKNSAEAIPAQGGRIVISVESHDDLSVLAVSDNGCGIAPENLKLIFDDGFSTKPARGTGLGLTIVRRICETFGASVRVDSTLGKGTKIEVAFPAAANNLSVSMYKDAMP